MENHPSTSSSQSDAEQNLAEETLVADMDSDKQLSPHASLSESLMVEIENKQRNVKQFALSESFLDSSRSVWELPEEETPSKSGNSTFLQENNLPQFALSDSFLNASKIVIEIQKEISESEAIQPPSADFKFAIPKTPNRGKIADEHSSTLPTESPKSDNKKAIFNLDFDNLLTDETLESQEIGSDTSDSFELHFSNLDDDFDSSILSKTRNKALIPKNVSRLEPLTECSFIDDNAGDKSKIKSPGIDTRPGPTQENKSMLVAETPPAKLKVKLNTVTAHLSSLSSELTELREFTTLELQCLMAEQMMNSENEKLQKQLSEMQSALKLNQNTIESLQAELSETNGKFQTIINENEQLKKDNLLYKNKCIDEERKLQEAEKKWFEREKDFKKSLEDARDLLKTNQDKIDQMKINRPNESSMDFTRTVEDLHDELSLSTIIGNQLQELSQIDITVSETVVSEVIDQAKVDLENEIKEYKIILEQKCAEIESLNNDFKRQLQEKELIINQLESQLLKPATHTTSINLQDACTKTTTVCNCLESQEEITKLRAEISQYKHRIQDLESEIKDFDLIAAVKDEEFEVLKKELTEYVINVHNEQIAFAEEQQSFKTITSYFSDIETIFQETNDNLNRISSEFNEKLTEKESKIQNLEMLLSQINNRPQIDCSMYNTNKAVLGEYTISEAFNMETTVCFDSNKTCARTDDLDLTCLPIYEIKSKESNEQNNLLCAGDAQAEKFESQLEKISLSIRKLSPSLNVSVAEGNPIIIESLSNLQSTINRILKKEIKEDSSTFVLINAEDGEKEFNFKSEDQDIQNLREQLINCKCNINNMLEKEIKLLREEVLVLQKIIEDKDNEIKNLTVKFIQDFDLDCTDLMKLDLSVQSPLKEKTFDPNLTKMLNIDIPENESKELTNSSKYIIVLHEQLRKCKYLLELKDQEINRLNQLDKNNEMKYDLDCTQVMQLNASSLFSSEIEERLMKSKLDKEVSELKKTQIEKEEEINTLQKEITNLLAYVNSNIQQNLTDFQMDTTMNSSLKSEVESEICPKMQSLIELNKTIENLIQKFKNMEQVNVCFQTDLNKLQQEFSLREETFKIVSEEKVRLEEQICAKDLEIYNLNQESAVQKAETSEKINQLDIEISDLKSKLLEKEAEIEEIGRSKIAECVKLEDEISAKNLELQKILQEFLDQKSTDSEKIAQLENYISDLESKLSEKIAEIEIIAQTKQAECVKLEEQISAKNSEIEQLEIDISNLKSTISERVEEIREITQAKIAETTKLEEEITASRSEVEKLSQAVSSKVAEVEEIIQSKAVECVKLGEQILAKDSEIERLLQEMSNQNCSASGKIEQLENEIFELKTQISLKDSELQEVIHSKTSEYLKLEEEMSASNLEIDKLGKDISSLKETISEKDNVIQEITQERLAECSRLEEEIAAQCLEIENLDQKLSSLRSEKDAKIEEITQEKVAEISRLEEEITARNLQMDKLYQELSDLESEKHTKIEEITQIKTAECNKLAEEITTMNVEIERLQQEMSNQNSMSSEKIELLENEILILKSKIAETEEITQARTEECRKLEEEVTSKNTEIERLVEEMSNQNSMSSEKIELPENEILILKSKIAETEEITQARTEDCRKLEEEVTSKNMEIERLVEEMSTQNSTPSEKIEQLENEISFLKSKLSEAEEIAKAESEHCAKLDDEISAKNTEIERLSQQILDQESVEKIKHLENEIFILKSQLSEKDAQIENCLLQFQQQISKINSDIDSFENNCNSVLDKTGNLGFIVEQTNIFCVEMNNKFAKKELEAKIINESIEQMALVEKDLRNQIVELKKEYHNQEDELNQLFIKQDAFEQENHKLKEEVSQKTIVVDKLLEQNQIFKEDLFKKETEVEKLLNQISNKEMKEDCNRNEIDSLVLHFEKMISKIDESFELFGIEIESNIHSKIKAVDSLNQNCCKLERKFNEIRSENETLKQEVTLLTESKRCLDNESDHLKHQLSIKEQELETMLLEKENCLTSLRSQLTAKEEELKNVQITSELSKDEIDSLQKEILILQGEITTLRTTVDEKETEIAKLSEMETKECEFAALQEKLDSKDQMLKDVTIKNQELEDKISKLQEDIDIRESSISNLKMELNDVFDKLNVTDSEITQLRETIAIKEEEINKLGGTVSSLQIENEKIVTLENEIVQLKFNEEELSTNLSKVQEELGKQSDSFSQEMELKEESLQCLKDKLQILEEENTKIKDLEHDIQILNNAEQALENFHLEKQEQLKKEMNAHLEEMDLKEIELFELKSKLEKLIEENSQIPGLLKEINQLKSMVDDDEKELEEIKKEKENFMKVINFDYSNLQLSCSEHKKLIDELNEDFDAFESKLSSELPKKIETLAKLECLIEKLKSTINSLKLKNEALEGEVSAKKEEIVQMKENEHRLEEQLNSLNEKISQSESKLRENQGELNKVKQEYLNKEEQEVEYQLNISHAQNKMTALEQEIENYKQKQLGLENLNKLLQDMKIELAEKDEVFKIVQMESCEINEELNKTRALLVQRDLKLEELSEKLDNGTCMKCSNSSTKVIIKQRMSEGENFDSTLCMSVSCGSPLNQTALDTSRLNQTTFDTTVQEQNVIHEDVTIINYSPEQSMYCYNIENSMITGNSVDPFKSVAVNNTFSENLDKTLTDNDSDGSNSEFGTPIATRMNDDVIQSHDFRKSLTFEFTDKQEKENFFTNIKGVVKNLLANDSIDELDEDNINVLVQQVCDNKLNDEITSLRRNLEQSNNTVKQQNEIVDCCKDIYMKLKGKDFSGETKELSETIQNLLTENIKLQNDIIQESVLQNDLKTLNSELKSLQKTFTDLQTNCNCKDNFISKILGYTHPMVDREKLFVDLGYSSEIFDSVIEGFCRTNETMSQIDCVDDKYFDNVNVMLKKYHGLSQSYQDLSKQYSFNLIKLSKDIKQFKTSLNDISIDSTTLKDSFNSDLTNLKINFNDFSLKTEQVLNENKYLLEENINLKSDIKTLKSTVNEYVIKLQHLESMNKNVEQNLNEISYKCERLQKIEGDLNTLKKDLIQLLCGLNLDIDENSITEKWNTIKTCVDNLIKAKDDHSCKYEQLSHSNDLLKQNIESLLQEVADLKTENNKIKTAVKDINVKYQETENVSAEDKLVIIKSIINNHDNGIISILSLLNQIDTEFDSPNSAWECVTRRIENLQEQIQLIGGNKTTKELYDRIKELETDLLDAENCKRNFAKELHALLPESSVYDLSKLQLSELHTKMIATIMEKEQIIITNITKGYEEKVNSNEDKLHQIEQEEKRKLEWIKELESENDKIVTECRELKERNVELVNDIQLKIEKLQSMEKAHQDEIKKLNNRYIFDETINMTIKEAPNPATQCYCQQSPTLKDRFNDLTEQLEAKTAICQNFETKVNENEEKISLLTKELTLKTEEISSFENRIALANGTYDELQKQYDEIVEEKNKLGDELASLNSALMKDGDNKSKQEALYNQLIEQHVELEKTLKEKTSEYESKICSLMEEITNFKNQYNSEKQGLLQEIDQLKETNSAKEQSNVESLKNEIQDLKMKLIQSNAEHLNEQSDRLEELTKLAMLNKEFEDEIARLKSNAEEVQSKFTKDLSEKVYLFTELSDKLKEVENTCEMLKEEINEKTSKITSLTKEIEEMEIEMKKSSKHSDSNCPYAAKHRAMQLELSDLDKKNKADQNRFAILRKNLEDDLRCKALMISDLDSKLKTANNNYFKAMQAKTETCEELESKLNEAKDKIKRLDEQIVSQRDIYIKEKHALEHEIATKTKLVNDSESEVKLLKQKQNEILSSLDKIFQQLNCKTVEEAIGLIKSNSSLLSELKEQLEEEKETNRQLDNEGDILNSHIQYLEKELNQKLMEIENVTKKVKENNSSKKEFENEIKSLKNQLSSIREEHIKEMNSKDLRIKEVLQKLHFEMSKQEKMKANNTQMQNEVIRLRKEIDELCKKIQHYDSLLKNNSVEYEKVCKLLKEEREKCQSVVSRTKQLESKIVETEKMNKDLENQLESSQTVISNELKPKIEQYEIQIKKHLVDYDEVKNRLQQEHEQRKKEMVQVKKLENDLFEIKQKNLVIDDLELKIQQYEIQIQNNADEYNKISLQLQEEYEKSRWENARANQLEIEIAQMQKRLVEFETELRNSKKIIQDLEDERKNLYLKYSELEAKEQKKSPLKEVQDNVREGFNKEVQKYKLEIANKNTAIANLEIELKRQNIPLMEKNELINSYKAKISQMKSEILSLKSQIEKTQTDNAHSGVHHVSPRSSANTSVVENQKLMELQAKIDHQKRAIMTLENERKIMKKLASSRATKVKELQEILQKMGVNPSRHNFSGPTESDAGRSQQS